MNNNSWKLMGKKQILSGLRYLEKLNPSSDITGKGVLTIIQGAGFMFNLDTSKIYAKYGAKGSYSDIASKLGDVHSNKEWRNRMWTFLIDKDPNFKNVAEKMAKQKKTERKKLSKDKLLDKFMQRYPHLTEVESSIKNCLVKGGQSFMKNQKAKMSPVNEIDVETSSKKLDVFVATIEILQPKALLKNNKKEYRKYTSYVNLQTSQVKFTDNHVIYKNYCHKFGKKFKKSQKPFYVSGKFQSIRNLQPYFTQYLTMCKQEYTKLGIKM